MGNVVRIGDSVSCGDHAADGSPNTFAGGMPITHSGVPATTGHGCFPPSVFVGPWTSTVFVNNNPVALVGTSINSHRCGTSSHGGAASSSASTVSFEQ